MRTLVEKEYDRKIAGILMICIVTAISYNLVAREFNLSARWIAETSQLFTLWMVYILLARMEIQDQHLRINYFYNLLPPHLKYYLDIFVNIVHVVSLVILIDATYYMFTSYMGTTTPAASIPTPLLFLSALVGFSLFLTVYFARFVSFISRNVENLNNYINAKY